MELFLGQRVVGEFPFGSDWGWESWAGEVPYRDRAGPSSFTRPGTGRPPRSPEAPAPHIHPLPRAEQPFSRASQEPLCKVLAFALPPAAGNPSLFPAAWGRHLCPEGVPGNWQGGRRHERCLGPGLLGHLTCLCICHRCPLDCLPGGGCQRVSTVSLA